MLSSFGHRTASACNDTAEQAGCSPPAERVRDHTRDKAVQRSAITVCIAQNKTLCGIPFPLLSILYFGSLLPLAFLRDKPYSAAENEHLI